MGAFYSERARTLRAAAAVSVSSAERNNAFSFLFAREKPRAKGATKPKPKPIVVAKKKAVPPASSTALPTNTTAAVAVAEEEGEREDGAREADFSVGRFLSLWRHLASLRARREDVEDSLLFSAVQERCIRRLEGALLLALLLPPLARPALRAQWIRERQLARESRPLLRALRLVEAEAEVDGSGALAGPEEFSALDMWLRCFDVDCSGSFDESSLRVILRAVRRNIDSAQLLHDFPHMRLPGESPCPVLLLVLILTVAHFPRCESAQVRGPPPMTWCATLCSSIRRRG